MNAPNFGKAAFALFVASTLTVGCGGEELEHRTVQQNISSSMTNVSQSAVDSLRFLEHSNLFSSALGSYDSTRCDGGAVLPPDPYGDDPYGNDPYGERCGEPVDFDYDINDDRAMAIDMLNKHVFATGNIENEGRGEVTYLLRGRVVCTMEGMAPEELSECTRTIDAAQIRLKVVAAGEHNVDVSVLVGPNRLNPVDFEFYRDRLGIEIDLGGIKSSIGFIAGILGEEAPELPTTMEGRARFAIEAQGPKKMSASAGVLRDIRVAGGDFELALARADQAFVVTADGTAQTIAASLALAPIRALFTVQPGYRDDGLYLDDDYYDGDYTQPETNTEPIAYGLNLGGASMTGLFEAAQDIFTLTNVGLGNQTTTLDINAERVFALDINANAGRTFDLTIESNEDGPDWTISPSLDLRMVFELIKVRDQLNDVADWMLDEIINIKLDGADAPRIRTLSDGLQVLAGRLTMTAEKAAITHTVEANQCLLDTYVPVDCFEVDCEPELTEPHPFEELEVSTCG